MEMTLNLTFEDGLKIVEAMKEVAIENGWDAEELGECGVIEEYSRVIDAALSAMGINISIDANPSCEYEDEDEDFDEDDFDFDFDDDEDDEEDDDDNVTYSLTVKGEFALRYMEAGHSYEEACEVADLLFGSNEDESEDEDGEDEDDDDVLIIAGMLAGALESRKWDTNDPDEMKLLVKTVLSATVQFKAEVLGE